MEVVLGSVSSTRPAGNGPGNRASQLDRKEKRADTGVVRIRYSTPLHLVS